MLRWGFCESWLLISISNPQKNPDNGCQFYSRYWAFSCLHSFLFLEKKKKVLLEDSCFTILCYFSSFIKPSFKKLSVVKGKGRPFSLWSWTTHIRQRLLVFDLKEFKWAPHDLWSHLSPFLSHIYFDHHWAHFFTHQFCCHNRQAGVSFLRKCSFKTAPKIIFDLMNVKVFLPISWLEENNSFVVCLVGFLKIIKFTYFKFKNVFVFYIKEITGKLEW